MHIKICGLTTFEDAWHACQAGADLLGFNFYSGSPRHVSVDTARRIVADLRQRGAQVKMVGVFVNHSIDDVRDVDRVVGLDLLQLSGDEPPELVQALGRKAFKAVRPESPVSATAEGQRYAGLGAVEPALLVDARHAGTYGGTGQLADWQAASSLAAAHAVLLAGGLTPDNVAEAVASVRPWGVDVASGVESAPGRKDPAKVIAFVAAARSI